MGIARGTNIVKDNLVFGYDSNYGVADYATSTRFYKGAPTTNPIHGQNARADSSYTTYSATSSGNWNANHPNAIRAYNVGGGDITGYYNSGVGNAANTHHAHWQLDPILKKPVVVMNDVAGQWKAKSFGTGLGSWNSQGKTHGDTYTISWLQWVDDLSKNARTGLYTKTTSGSNGFHDGQSTSASSYNTKLTTWQRVYQTYTTASSRDLSDTMASIYMYGHYSPRGVVKVADVQWQWGSTPYPFVEEGTGSSYGVERSATQSLIDLKRTVNIDVSNVSFDSTGQLTFDGTDDVINLPNNLGYGTTSVSVFAWYKINGTPANGYHVICGDAYLEISIHSSATYIRNGVQTSNGRFVSNNGNQTLNDGNYHYYGFTFDGSTKRAYIDGVQVGTQSVTGTLVTSFSGRKVGAFSGGYYANGDLPVYKVYNKVLTDAEVKQNYNAYKNRFNT